MKLELFAMERMQSSYENQVEYNLSESGVHPMRVDELLQGPEEIQRLLEQPLCYTQSNGTIELRTLIAGIYAGATIEHVEVTNGGSEANFIVTWNLLEPGDEVVMMVPNYMQAWGLSRAFAGTVHPWALREVTDDGVARWRPDIEALRALVNARTKLILICNPNNPTSARIGEKDLNDICTIAARHGTWILSDEIYRGAELNGPETPSLWGRYERAIVTSGLSKAYGLPGLRIGWIVAPPALVARLWSYHDYTTISPGALSDLLARVALRPATRQRLLERTRRILRENYPVVRAWIEARRDTFSHVPPEAGAIVYVRYRQPINSTELVTRLREEKSVLIVPGDHFGMDHYLRIGYGDRLPYLQQGLARVHDLLASLEQRTA
jgi:aspartate/methionine/tyrosine aminotransferase